MYPTFFIQLNVNKLNIRIIYYNGIMELSLIDSYLSIDKVKDLLERVTKFMDDHVYEGEKVYADQMTEFRNQGNGIKVINYLLEEAKKLKITKISIETGAGNFFIPARKLFNSCGFKPCQPFAHYKEDNNSLYLTKLLDNN